MPVGYIIIEHEGQSQHVDIQIQLGVCQRCPGGVWISSRSVGRRTQSAEEHQHQTDHAAGNQGGVHGGFHLAESCFAPKSWDTTTEQPMLQPKAKAMKIRVIS